MAGTFSWKDAPLPVPEPLQEAVEAGVFGVCVDGSLRPSVEEVAALTREQARELLSLLVDLRHLKRCLERHLNPHTHQPLVSWEIRERIERSMQAGVENVRENYTACLSAYADAFGSSAAEGLDTCVQQLLERPELDLERIEIQRSLFDNF